MRLLSISFLLVLFVLFSGCAGEDPDQAPLLILTQDFDFNEDDHDWVAGFSDYPSAPQDSSQYELKYAYTEPTESKLTKRSIMLSGKNLNRDLFMFIKKKVSSLKPDTDYTVTFNVELASDLNSALPTAGGSVFLKAGAAEVEPTSLVEAGNYVMNIDKGNEDMAGQDMVILGDIFATGTGTSYSLITRSNTMANSRYVVRTNSDGDLWLIVGTDSSMEGTTKVFYTRIKVVLSAS